MFVLSGGDYPIFCVSFIETMRSMRCGCKEANRISMLMWIHADLHKLVRVTLSIYIPAAALNHSFLHLSCRRHKRINAVCNAGNLKDSFMKMLFVLGIEVFDS